MKILYDFQVFSWQRHGGISRYFAELIRHAKKDNTLSVEISIQHSVNAYLDQLGIKQADKPSLVYKLKNKILKKLRILAPNNYENSRRRLKRGDFDLFHPTYYEDYFLEVLNKPLVITVYDMIHEKFPDYFPATDHTSNLKKRVLSRASKIIAISECTKKDLVEVFGIPEEKIKVIYLGHPEVKGVKKTLPSELNLVRGKFLLFVGERGKYKNFSGFVSASAKFLIENNIKLICFGGGPFNSSELKQLSKLGINTQTVHVSGEDDLLFALYSHALAFCFPSLYEGFGLPVLEAMAYGCLPILESNRCLLEVGGNAALYADTKIENSWHNALESALNDLAVVREIKGNGSQRLELFSWEKTFEETKALYHEVLANADVSKVK